MTEKSNFITRLRQRPVIPLWLFWAWVIATAVLAVAFICGIVEVVTLL